MKEDKLKELEETLKNTTIKSKEDVEKLKKNIEIFKKLKEENKEEK